MLMLMLMRVLMLMLMRVLMLMLMLMLMLRHALHIHYKYKVRLKREHEQQKAIGERLRCEQIKFFSGRRLDSSRILSRGLIGCRLRLITLFNNVCATSRRRQ